MTGESVKGWRIARVAGVPVRMRASTLITFGLLWLLLFPQLSLPLSRLPEWVTVAVTSLTALGFLASVVAHEVAHAVAARTLGLPVTEVRIFHLGGVTRLGREPETARDEYIVAVVGPLTNLLAGGVLIAAGAALGATSVAGGTLTFLGQLNAAIGAFNLLPGHPLDGGVLLRAGVWAVTGQRVRAARLSARAGVGLAYVLIAVGIVGGVLGPRGGDGFGLFWLAVIGLFTLSSARAGLAQSDVRARLDGLTARSLARAAPWRGQSDWTIARVVADVTRSQQEGVVEDTDGGAVGIFGPDDLAEVPSGAWDHYTLGESMTAFDGRVDPDDDLFEILGRFRLRADSVLAVITHDEPVSILRARDVLDRMRPKPRTAVQI